MVFGKNCATIIFIYCYFSAGCSATKKNSIAINTLNIIQVDSIIRVPAPFVMPGLKIFKHPNKIYTITKYGAVEGGNISNTKAIASAIEECNANGGGTVLVSNGKWLTGKIHFRSNVNLHLQDSAELIFSDDYKDYLPAVQS